MTAEQERLVKASAEAAHRWWISLGDLAWVLLGLALLLALSVGILLVGLLVRRRQAPRPR
ncbi:MAG: hypothetical protein U1G07_03155 [Verrucomicrobiota bacterium]